MVERGHADEVVGVIDLGTHSCLLLVGRRGPGAELEVLEDRCEVPALGEGLAASGRLAPAAIERTLGVLAAYVERARELGCGRLIAGGTAAMRRAANTTELVAQARARLGLELELIDELREAQLAWRAAVGRGAGEGLAVVDVGGGSTEVALRGGQERLSRPVGAVVLAELEGPEAPWERLLERAREAFAEAPPTSGAARAVALGGTASNLGALALGLPAFDHLAVEGAELELEEVSRQGRRLAILDLNERSSLPIEAARAAVLPAGLACLAAGLEYLGATRLRVSGRGLRYGLLTEALGI